MHWAIRFFYWATDTNVGGQHVYQPRGYNTVSGFASDIQELEMVALLGIAIKVLLTILRHHQCHVDGCKRLGHNDPAVHAPACHEHHTSAHLRGKPPASGSS